MIRLSVTVITLNEEKYITECLESVKDIADEIIVVDSGSTDKTLEIARKYTSNIFDRKFDNFASQKNFAAGKTTGNWILSLDADEQISSELASEIKEVISVYDSKFSAYTISRNNYIFGRFIRHSRWQPELDRHVWLWKKGKGKWVGDVHEEVKVEGEIGRLKGAKIHHHYDSVSEFVSMLNSYSDFEAGERIQNGERLNFKLLLLDPIYNFLVRFFYRLGFLDGKEGFILSFLMAYYHLEIAVKVWEKPRKS